MELTKRALGYLKKRYSVVLKKNYMLNTFGALALAGAMVVGGAGMAGAAPVEIDDTWTQATDNTKDAILNADVVTPGATTKTAHNLNLNNKKIVIDAGGQVNVDANSVDDMGKLSFGSGTNTVDGNLGFGKAAANGYLTFNYFDGETLGATGILHVTGNMDIVDRDLGRSADEAHHLYVGNIDPSALKAGINVGGNLTVSTTGNEDKTTYASTLTVSGKADNAAAVVASFTGNAADKMANATVSGAVNITAGAGGATAAGGNATVAINTHSTFTGGATTITGGAGADNAGGGALLGLNDATSTATVASLTITGGAGADNDGGAASVTTAADATLNINGAVSITGGAGGAAVGGDAGVNSGNANLKGQITGGQAVTITGGNAGVEAGGSAVLILEDGTAGNQQSSVGAIKLQGGLGATERAGTAELELDDVTALGNVEVLAGNSADAMGGLARFTANSLNAAGKAITVTAGKAGTAAAGGGADAGLNVANAVQGASLSLTGGAGSADAAVAGGDATASIGEGSNIAGAVTLQGGAGGAFAGAALGGDAVLTVNGGHNMRIGSLTMTAGADGAHADAKGGKAMVNIANGELTINSDLSTTASKLVASASNHGEIAIAAAGELDVKNLTLTSDAAQTITLGGATSRIDVDTLTVVNTSKADENNLTIATGTLEISGAESGSGVALTAGTVTLDATGTLEFGDAQSPHRGGDINAKISTAVAGKVQVVGGTWAAKQAIDLGATGTLLMTAGTFDASGTTLKAAADKITTSAGSTLVVNSTSAGFNADTGAFTAKDLGATQANVAGAVTIAGLTAKSDVAYADYRTKYVDEAAGLFTGAASLNLLNITPDLTGATLGNVDPTKDVSGDTSLGNYAVAIGTGTVTGNTVVGSVTGQGDVAVSTGKSLEITGKNAANGVLLDGNINLAAVADSVTLGTGTVTGKVDGSGNLTATGATKVAGVDGVSVAALNVNQGAGLETTKIVATADATIGGAVKTTGADGVDVRSIQMNSSSASLNTSKVVATGADSNILGTATVTGEFDATGNTVYVGNDNNTGSLSAGTFKGDVVADPDWGKAASTVAFGDVSASKLLAARNSTIAVGTTDTMWIQNTMKNANLSLSNAANGVTAAFGITGKALDIVTKTTDVLVNGALDQTGATAALGGMGNAGDATFAASSLLVVDAAVANATTFALTANNVTVDSTAKLLVTNVGLTDGKAVVNVAEATALTQAAAGNGWATESNVYFDSKFLDGKLDATELAANKAVVNVSQVLASTIFPRMDSGLASLIDTGIRTNVNSAGMDFVKKASLLPDSNEGAATIEGGAQIGNVVGVASYTAGVAKATSGALAVRNTVSGAGAEVQETAALTLGEDGLSAGSGMKNGLGVWLMPLYKWSTISGAESGNFDNGFDVGLGGVALGTDYTFNDMFRLGLALNIGAGYSEANGSFNSAQSDFDFWGVSAYGAYMKDNFTALLDIGYTGVYSEASYDVPTAMTTGNLKSDITSNVWTVGLTAEYVWETSALDIMPHAGVRYMGITTDEYNVNSGLGRVFEVESNHQSVWYFPVGVTLSKDFAMKSGWHFTPKLDVGFIAAAGDLETTANTSIAGVAGSTDLTMKNVDGFAFNGGLGFDIANENLTLGINYNILASEHETDHMVFATFRYDF